jgi:hypothetical protein
MIRSRGGLRLRWRACEEHKRQLLNFLGKRHRPHSYLTCQDTIQRTLGYEWRVLNARSSRSTTGLPSVAFGVASAVTIGYQTSFECPKIGVSPTNVQVAVSISEVYSVGLVAERRQTSETQYALGKGHSSLEQSGSIRRTTGAQLTFLPPPYSNAHRLESLAGVPQVHICSVPTCHLRSSFSTHPYRRPLAVSRSNSLSTDGAVAVAEVEKGASLAPPPTEDDDPDSAATGAASLLDELFLL